MSSGATAPAVEAPGPGQWVLDTGHFPRPATRFTAELFPEPSADGFAEGTAAFGLLFHLVEWAFIDGWGYMAPRPVAALAEAGELTRQGWDDLVRRSPDLAARLATSATVFEHKRWRRDLAYWDEECKPALVDRHRRVQGVDPARLDDEGLAAQLDQCRENLRLGIRTHHRFNVTPVLPVGELLRRCQAWTGAGAVEVLGLLRGAGPLAVGASDALAQLADAIRDDDHGRSLLRSGNGGGGVLTALRAAPGPVGRLTARYLDLIGHWSAGSGFDIDEPTLAEMPDLLVESVRVAVTNDAHTDADDEATEVAARLRSGVPSAEQGEFDDLLAEARLVHRLRDERALYCDVWANGLMRRAILAGGARLVERGELDDPVHLVEATYGEMRSLLERGEGPGGGDLADRARRRAEADSSAVPAVLGHASRRAVPTEWLPPGAARTEAAFRTYLAAMADGDDRPASGPAVRGMPASPGVYQGRARVVHGASGIGRIRDGDVLVADATSPAFNVVLPLLGAIVTDRGGMLSHAAIVAREYGIPAVVGCDDATRRICDGARLRVDGGSGEVTILNG